MAPKYFHADWTTPIEEIKRQYRDLAIKNHPDMGGSVEAMAEINAEFEHFKRTNYNIHESAEGGVYTDERQEGPDKTTEDFVKIIEALLRMSIDVELVGSWIWLSGDTKPHREQLKAMGFRWSGQRLRWYLAPKDRKWHRHSSEDMDGLRARYGSAWFEAKRDALATA